MKLLMQLVELAGIDETLAGELIVRARAHWFDAA